MLTLPRRSNIALNNGAMFFANRVRTYSNFAICKSMNPGRVYHKMFSSIHEWVYEKMSTQKEFKNICFMSIISSDLKYYQEPGNTIDDF